MNILILSAGTRNKIVEYFVKTLSGNGKVVATDMSKLAPAIYEADKYYATGMLKNPIPSSPAGFWESSVRFCVNQEPL